MPIGPIYHTTALDLYAVVHGNGADYNDVRNFTLNVWESLDTNVRDHYDAPLTETPAGSGHYYAATPTGLTAYTGHNLSIYQRMTGTALDSDPLVNTGWMGPSESNVTAKSGAAETLVTTSNLPSNFADLDITSSTGRVSVGTNNDKTGYVLHGTQSFNTTGSVGSVTGAVGSVSGNVGGNVVGSVASVAGDVGGNVSGNVAGSVASVTGNVGGSVASVVGSVGGNVDGNVAGSVASVAGNVGGNVVGSVASVAGNVDGNVSGNVVGSVASVAGNVGGNIVGSVASVAGNVAGNVNGNVAGTVASVVGNVGGNVSGNVTGTVSAVVGNVGGNVVGTVASVTAGVTIALGAIKKVTFDESTAFPLLSADTGSSQVLRKGSGSITGTTLDTAIGNVEGGGGGGGGTISPDDVSPGRTWKFASRQQVIAPNKVIETTHFIGVVAMDFSRALNPGQTIHSVTDAILEASAPADTEPVINESAVSPDKLAAHVTLDCTEADIGRHTMTVKILTTDGQVIFRRGVLVIE